MLFGMELNVPDAGSVRFRAERQFVWKNLFRHPALSVPYNVWTVSVAPSMIHVLNPFT
jgi:hypothetical protein